jgi:hypothetical protein
MKNQYTEGPKALENFEEGMKAIFKVPKDAVVLAAKKGKVLPASRVYVNPSVPTRTRRGVPLPSSLSLRGTAIRSCLSVAHR